MNTPHWMTIGFDLLQESALLGRLVSASIEFAALALLVWMLIHLARIRQPRLIALLWLVVLAKPLVSFALGAWLPSFLISAPVGATSVVATTIGQPGTSALVSANPSLAQAGFTLSQWAILLWGIGAACFVLLTLRESLQLRGLLKHARQPDERLLTSVRQAMARLQLRRHPRLCLSDRVSSPALCGIFRPVILIPAWMLEEEHPEALIWSLHHELAHYRLHDPLALAVRQLTRILFYFHPLTWWVGMRWERATEMACDQAIVTSEGEARRYAEGLLQILNRVRAVRGTLASGTLHATRSQIRQRIEFLLTAPRQFPPLLSHASTFAILLLAIISGSIGCSLHRSNPKAELLKAYPEIKQASARKITYDKAKNTFTLEGNATIDQYHGDKGTRLSGDRVIVSGNKSGSPKMEILWNPANPAEHTPRIDTLTKDGALQHMPNPAGIKKISAKKMKYDETDGTMVAEGNVVIIQEKGGKTIKTAADKMVIKTKDPGAEEIHATMNTPGQGPTIEVIPNEPAKKLKNY